MIKYFKIIFIASLLGAALPVITQAAGYKYFELAPQTGETITVSQVNTPSQIIYPQNDFISGFDLWLDNDGSPGTATFNFSDSGGSVLASTNVTIPTIPPIWSGQVFHIDLPSPVPVISTAMYRLSIVSSMPSLRIYYTDSIQLLGHNSPYPSPEKVLGLAQLGTASQNFYFKIALYENGDTAPPIFSNVSSSVTSDTTAAVSFNADEPVDFKIVFTDQSGMNQVKNWSGIYGFCNPGIASCGATFNIVPSMSYNYTIYAMDYAGNQSQTSGSITTPASPTAPSSSSTSPTSTTGAPVISGARIASLDANRVTVTWQTDVAADSKLAASLDPLGIHIIASAIDTTVEFYHALTITGLAQQTNYYVALSSAAPGGPPASQVLSFTTPQGTPGNPTTTSTPINPSPPSSGPTPTPTNPQPNSSPNQGGNPNQPMNPASGNNYINTLPVPEVTVTPATESSDSVISVNWSAPASGEPDRGYQIDVLDENNQLAQRIIVPAGTHHAEIRGLPPGNYHLIIYANQDGVLVKIARVLIVNIPKGALPFLNSTTIYSLVIIGVILGAIAAFYVIKLRRV